MHQLTTLDMAVAALAPATPQPNGTYYNQATDTATYNAFLGAPRTWGVTARFKF